MNELIDITTPQDKLEELLISETDPTKIQNIVDIFNMNIKKKDILRNNKLNDLQDRISEQMTERVVNNANQFSNKDLLDYFKVINDTVAKFNDSDTSIDIPAIQVVKNQLNVNVEEAGATRDSRQRIINAVNAILKKSAIECEQAEEETNIEPEATEEPIYIDEP